MAASRPVLTTLGRRHPTPEMPLVLSSEHGLQIPHGEGRSYFHGRCSGESIPDCQFVAQLVLYVSRTFQVGFSPICNGVRVAAYLAHRMERRLRGHLTSQAHEGVTELFACLFNGIHLLTQDHSCHSLKWKRQWEGNTSSNTSHTGKSWLCCPPPGGLSGPQCLGASRTIITVLTL